MRKIGYWMYFQMFIGCWLVISPFVVGYEEMKWLSASNMISGGILIVIGLGVLLYKNLTCEEDSGRRSGLPMGEFFRKI